jgi:hypothetical protein
MVLFLAGADVARCPAEMAWARIGEADAAARALGRGIEVDQWMDQEDHTIMILLAVIQD